MYLLKSWRVSFYVKNKSCHIIKIAHVWLIMATIIIKYFRLSRDVVTWDVRHANPYKALCSAVIGWFSTAEIGASRSSLWRVVLSAVRFSPLSCCCVSWSWPSMLLEFQFHYSCCYVINKRANNLRSNECQYLIFFFLGKKQFILMFSNQKIILTELFCIWICRRVYTLRTNGLQRNNLCERQRRVGLFGRGICLPIEPKVLYCYVEEGKHQLW